MTTPKANSDCQVSYLLSDAIGRTRSRSRSRNHATGRGSMARADSKTAQLRLISVASNSLSKLLWRPLAGRHVSGVLRACRSGLRRSSRRGSVKGGQHQSGRAGWALLGSCPVIGGEQGSNLARKCCRVRRLLVTVRHTIRAFCLAALCLEARRSTLFGG